MSITIRAAVPSDAPAIQALSAQLTAGAITDGVAERIQDIITQGRDGLFVAETEGYVCGYIQVAPYDATYRPRGAEVMSLVVDDARRRAGAGTALLARAEQWARERGAAYAHLYSGAERAGAHTFYETRGYTLRKMSKSFIKNLT